MRKWPISVLHLSHVTGQFCFDFPTVPLFIYPEFLNIIVVFIDTCEMYYLTNVEYKEINEYLKYDVSKHRILGEFD